VTPNRSAICTSVAGSSFSRSCLSIPVLDAVAAAGASATTSAKELNFLACDGVDSTYELDFAKPPPNAGVAATFRDFSISGALQQIVGTAALAKLATSSGTKWSVADAAPWFPENGVVNSASATADFAPGAILTIYGAGFGYDPATTRVEAGGVACRIVYVAPFQMSIQLPETVPTGSVSLRISNPSGTFERNLNIRNVAPGIFAFPGQVAITNQNGSLNSISNPATRGQAIVIYSTGLGITATQGNLSVATVPVQVVLAGQELTPFFAGGTPGIPGLYQVNVVIPATFAPGLGIPISLRQGTANSNSVPLAIQ